MNKHKKALIRFITQRLAKLIFFFVLFIRCVVPFLSSFLFFAGLATFLVCSASFFLSLRFGNVVYASSRFTDSIIVAFIALNSVVGRRMFTFRIHLMFVVSQRHFSLLAAKEVEDEVHTFPKWDGSHVTVAHTVAAAFRIRAAIFRNEQRSIQPNSFSIYIWCK